MNKGLNISGRGEHTGVATSAISAYRLVKFSASAPQGIEQVTSASDKFIGASTCATGVNGVAAIVTHGETYIEVSGTVVAGDYVKANASGQVVVDSAPALGVTVGQALSNVQVEGGVNVVLVRLI